jgi:ABC-type lipoprotein release transport system permease subunit
MRLLHHHDDDKEFPSCVAPFVNIFHSDLLRVIAGTRVLGVTILLTVVGLTACYAPASRAAASDPLRVLRND